MVYVSNFSKITPKSNEVLFEVWDEREASKRLTGEKIFKITLWQVIDEWLDDREPIEL